MDSGVGSRVERNFELLGRAQYELSVAFQIWVSDCSTQDSFYELHLLFGLLLLTWHSPVSETGQWYVEFYDIC